jgi:hypothetical protein
VYSLRCTVAQPSATKYTRHRSTASSIAAALSRSARCCCIACFFAVASTSTDRNRKCFGAFGASTDCIGKYIGADGSADGSAGDSADGSTCGSTSRGVVRSSSSSSRSWKQGQHGDAGRTCQGQQRHEKQPRRCCRLKHAGECARSLVAALASSAWRQLHHRQ